MKVSTEGTAVLVLKSDTEEPVQEKAGDPQAQGAEQVRLLGQPASRVPGIRMLGVLVRSGEERGDMEDQDGVRHSFRGSPGSDTASPLNPDAQIHCSQEGLLPQACPVAPMAFPGGFSASPA